eukprot:jgi/Chrpa1/19073/Chrysochromulina_OHIO_Genome00010239-RA
MMVMDEHQGKRSLAQIREAARRSFVNAMRYGQILLVRMSNTAARFKGRYSDPKTFPLAIFDHEIVDGLMRQYSGAASDNLYQSSHPLAACLREDDTEHGFFTVRQGFEVVVSTHFARDTFAGYLENWAPEGELAEDAPWGLEDAQMGAEQPLQAVVLAPATATATAVQLQHKLAAAPVGRCLCQLPALSLE